MKRQHSRKRGRQSEVVILPPDVQIILPPDVSSRQRGADKQQEETSWAGHAGVFMEREETLAVDVSAETFAEDEVGDDEWDMGEGLSWEDIPSDEDEEKKDDDIAPGGTLLVGKMEAKLIGVNPDAPLFSGSPHSGRDMARYVMALKQTCGKNMTHFFVYIYALL